METRFVVATLALGFSCPAWAAEGLPQKTSARSCAEINLNANEMADCRVRYNAAKNDGERRDVLKFFAAGGDQRASDPNSEGHAVSGKDTQHTPSRDVRTTETPPKEPPRP